MQDYTSLDQTQLNTLLNGASNEPLIPESLTTFLIICFVVINLLTITFLILWIIGMVRRWKVQSAILHMQKDITEIKQALATQTNIEKVTEPTLAEAPASSTAEPDQTNLNN